MVGHKTISTVSRVLLIQTEDSNRNGTNSFPGAANSRDEAIIGVETRRAAQQPYANVTTEDRIRASEIILRMRQTLSIDDVATYYATKPINITFASKLTMRIGRARDGYFCPSALIEKILKMDAGVMT